MDEIKFPCLEEKRENLVQVHSFGRTYTYDGTVLPSSVLSQGQELLAGPMTFSLKSNGEEMVFTPATVLPTTYQEDSCTLVATTESSLFYVNTCVTTEEDGCTFANVTLMPRGFTVRQIFGLEPKELRERTVEHFYLDIPVRKDAVEFYHVPPDTKLTGDFPADMPRELSFCDFIPKGGFASEFAAQVLLCGEKVGLGAFFTTNEGWSCADEKRVFEVIETENAYVLRIHFLDGTPESWGASCKNVEIADRLVPVTFKFGFMATPVRQLPKRPFIERSFHVDCFKKIATNYEEFFANPVVEGSEEIGFDRLQRLGVKTLYIHEKWNDMQNSPILTDRNARRLRFIVSECHKRGIKVVPYFGFEVSSLSPHFAQYGRKLMAYPKPDEEVTGSWNRWPAQRALRICQNGPWGEIFREGVKKIVEEYDLDGIYIDSMLGAFPCGNLEHGCGYVHNGKAIPTFSSPGVRKTVKELYNFVKARGGVLNCHGYGSMTLPGINYCTAFWEGENFQNLLMHGTIREMPEGHLRALYTGVNLGIPVYSLCYSEPPVWTYSNAISMALLHNSMPKPVDISEPLEETSKLWDIFDAFPLEKAQWHPYFHDHGVKVSNSGIKVSYYETDKEVLTVCSSVSMDFDGEVELDFTALGFDKLENRMTGETVCENGKVTLKFGGFQYYLLYGKKQ